MQEREHEVPSLVTPRLLLRQWHEDDLEPFVALCGDPEVMTHFPSLPSREECVDLVARHRANLDAGQPGLYAVESRADRTFLGFIGLTRHHFEAAFTPCVEVGWRLARAAWGHGYATEGALAALAHGFDVLGLEEIVSFTAVGNTRSQAVMRRIGMHTDPSEDFEHPAVPEGSPVRRHVLYRLGAREWRAQHRDATSLDGS